MRALWWVLVVLGIVWLWRSQRPQRRAPSPPTASPSSSGPGAVTMVGCARCQLHVPQHQAVEGRHGWYCCAEHLRLTEP